MGMQDRDWYHDHHDKFTGVKPRQKAKLSEKPLPVFSFPDLDIPKPPTNLYWVDGQTSWPLIIASGVIVALCLLLVYLKFAH